MKHKLIILITRLFIILICLSYKNDPKPNISFGSPLDFGLYIDTVEKKIGNIYYPVSNKTKYPIKVQLKSLNDMGSGETAVIMPGKTGVLVGYPLQNWEKTLYPTLIYRAVLVVQFGASQNETFSKNITINFKKSDRIYSVQNKLINARISKIIPDTTFSVNFLKLKNTLPYRQNLYLRCHSGYRIYANPPGKTLSDTICFLSIAPKKSTLVRFIKTKETNKFTELLLYTDSSSKNTKKFVIRN